MRILSSLALASTLGLLASTSAQAVLIDAKGTGIDYSLTETVNDSDTHTFVLTATNLNTAARH